MTRHFLTIFDLDRDELVHLLDRAAELKALRGTPAHSKPLEGKSVAVVFEKGVDTNSAVIRGGDS